MPPSHPGRAEFIALIAMLFASIAFSIDAMLPALPDIAAQMTPTHPNRAQLVVTSFVLGMGAGTLITGPLSDALGRRPVMLGGAALYIAGAFAASVSDRLEFLLAARFVQGLGAAGPRVVAMAVVRDLYAGRGMAQILSFVMMIFTIVPALAPLIGAGIIAVAGWRAIFWAFILFSACSALWLALRLPETLPRDRRRAFSVSAIRAAAGEMIAIPMVRMSIIVQCLCFAILFSMISTVQPIYDVTFGRAETFPLWFGAIAICATSGSFVNASLVMRLGMRRLVGMMLIAQVFLSGTLVVLVLVDVPAAILFAGFVVWQCGAFFQVGLTVGNLNALAMEPVGHIAGLAASIIGAVATVGAVVLAVPVGLLFDGTPLPLVASTLVFATLGAALLQRMKRLERQSADTSRPAPEQGDAAGAR